MKMKTTLAVLLILELYGLSSGLIKQHFFVDEQKPWASALQHCRTYYHDLSTFTNETEKQQFLGDAVGQTSDAWVGLYKESDVWKWIGGEYARQISNWPFYQLDQEDEDTDKDTDDTDYTDKDTDKQLDVDKNCAFISNINKYVQSEKCNEKYPFFCMTTFVLVLQRESWEGALEHCRKYYNDLASLSSTNKMNSTSGKITEAQTEYVWTGLRFLAGEWLWVNGDDLDFTAWSQTGQPQCPAGNLRCGALNKQTRVWTHRDCEEKLNFICQ